MSDETSSPQIGLGGFVEQAQALLKEFLLAYAQETHRDPIQFPSNLPWEDWDAEFTVFAQCKLTGTSWPVFEESYEEGPSLASPI